MNDRRRSEGFFDFTHSTQQARDAALLRATTDLFVQETLHDRDEIRRYEELATHLLPKVAVNDRIYVADRLAARMDAPVAIARALAKDRIEVARTIVSRSPVLGPLDLLAIVASTGPEHHAEIAKRPGLSTEVITALRASGDQGLVGLVDAMEASLRRSPKMEAAPQAATARPGRPAVRAHPPSVPLAPPPPMPAQERPPNDWFTHRQAVSLRSNRFDPAHFLGLDRAARLRMMAELATRPPVRRYAGSGDRLDRAFRSILGAAQIVGFARAKNRNALVSAIADGVGVPGDFVSASFDDATGEPLAVLLKVLGLDNTQAQQVLLLASKAGEDVTAFFKLCDVYAAMEPVVAETLIESWRQDQRPAIPRHEPLFAENADRRRTGFPEPARERVASSTQRPERFSGG